ncbi:MAG TPA: Fic family protein [Burkholderiaceae bacterium]|nr:Fic family protein [Burkholderiaceae bacterium]
MPSGLGALKHLRELDLAFNPITSLPADIVDLRNLKILNLNYCALEALPHDIGRLGQLEELQLKGNSRLKSLPDSLGDIDTLKQVDVTDCNGLENFPAGIDLYRVKVRSERTPLVLYPPFREAHFDSQTRIDLERSAQECKRRWDRLITEFTPEQLRAAYERDALKRARLSTTVSQMALPGEEPTPGVTFENWKRADALTIEWAQAGVPLDLDRLLELHALLYREIDNWRMNDSRNLAGKLREDEIFVADTWQTYPSHENIPRLLDDFFTWHARTRACLEASGDLVGQMAFAGQIYQRLVSIHPFSDANGRTSRLAMNWALRAAGLPPARIGRDDLGAPQRVALFATEGDGNRTPEQVTEMVLKGIHNTLRVYETELGVPDESADSTALSDDESLLEIFGGHLRAMGLLAQQLPSDSDSDSDSGQSSATFLPPDRGWGSR